VTASFTVAPNFQCKESWPERLLVAEGDAWRAPDDSELASLTRAAPAADGAASASLFSVPTHMRHRFWAMLDDEAKAGSGDFEYFSDDLAQFLAFKALLPPADAVYELLVQDVGGKVQTDDAWALINFGEEPVLLGWPGLQLRLDPGEGFQPAAGAPPAVLPPANDELNVLVAIRHGSASGADVTDGSAP
jgi:hypothetical protein